MFFNRKELDDLTKYSSSYATPDNQAEAFVSGSYTGCLGFWNVWVPEAVFKRNGNTVSGWMILVHDDFIVKQFFSGKIALDISGASNSNYRHIKVDLFGTEVEYLKTTSVFNERMKKRPDTFIRQISYSSFSQDSTDGGIVMLGRVNYSGLDREFPSYYYNLYGNFVLTKL